MTSDTTRALRRSGGGLRATTTTRKTTTTMTTMTIPPTLPTSSRPTLRYRTDLDKAVLHFAFVQHAPAEHVVVVASSSTSSTSSTCTTTAATRRSSSSSSSSLLSVSSTGTAVDDDDDDDTAVGDWHVYWMSVSRVQRVFGDVNYRLGERQIINHFPNHHELTRKDLMYKNLRRYLRDKATPLLLQPPSSLSSSSALTHARRRQQQQQQQHQLLLQQQQPHELVVAQQYRGMQSLHAATNMHKSNISMDNDNNKDDDVGGENNGSSSSSSNNNRRCHNVDDGRTTRIFRCADGVPITFNVPNDLSMFAEVCKQQPGCCWIVKPTARSQGKGIFLVRNAQQLTRYLQQQQQQQQQSERLDAPMLGARNTVLHDVPWQRQPQPQRQQQRGGRDARHRHDDDDDHHHHYIHHRALGYPSYNSGGARGGQQSYIVSKYIANPLLIASRKFDLRLYVLVTSFKPLVAYVHESGFARFCATSYVAAATTLSATSNKHAARRDKGVVQSAVHLSAHLTNVALQKDNVNYNAAHGGKLAVRNVWLYIEARYGAYATQYLITSIHFLIYHSLCAVADVMCNDKHAFELYGYDILLDDTLQPHLIEVNASPSLSTTTVADRQLKQQVLSDTLDIVLPPHYPAARCMSYSEYRLRTDLTTRLSTGFTLLDFASD